MISTALLNCDGKTHINVHTKATTFLGRCLSTYRHAKFIHPHYGPFCSVEGFIQYLHTGCEYDEMRSLSGYKAKMAGRKRKTNLKMSRSEYNNEILYATYLKILQNDYILQSMKESTLPFMSYYLFGPNKLIIKSLNADEFVEGLTQIREALIKDEIPPVLAQRIRKYSTDLTTT